VIQTEPTSPEDAARILEAVDAGFDTIVKPAEEAAPRPSPAAEEAARQAQHAADMASVQALFAEMAVAHARPLRDFMIEVSWGEPTREWLDVAGPASRALRHAAEAVEMTELAAALGGLGEAVELAAGEPAFGPEVKELISSAYGKLTALLPAVFALEGERGRREPIIVRGLLLQVPGVQKVAIDKLYAAGLYSLELISSARPKELAETTGLDLSVATGIHERFQSYRREIAALDPGKDRAAERAELDSLLGELMRAHAEHERLSSAWAGDAAARRAKARKERGDVWLRVSVLLARMGEVDRLQALERASFSQKIRGLEAFLEEAKSKAARP
jgi:hypothetical protein